LQGAMRMEMKEVLVAEDVVDLHGAEVNKDSVLALQDVENVRTNTKMKRKETEEEVEVEKT